MGGPPPNPSGRAARSRERDLSRSSAPEQAVERRSSRRNSSHSNDAPSSDTTLHPASAPGPQRGRAGLPPVAPVPVPTEVPPTDMIFLTPPETPTRILARPVADVEPQPEMMNSSVMPASPGGPPPDGNSPDNDEDPGPGDDPDHPGSQRCFRCGELVQWIGHNTWNGHNFTCRNRPGELPPREESSSPDKDRAHPDAEALASTIANPLDASSEEHSLVTETDSRQTTVEPVATDLTSRQTTEELVALDVGNARQTPPGNVSGSTTTSPQIMLHSHYKWDAGSLPADTFAALRTSTAVKPEHSASPSEGRAAGGPAATDQSVQKELPPVDEAPVFGRTPPPRTPAGVKPSRPFEVDPSPNSDREIGVKTPRVSPLQLVTSRACRDLLQTEPSGQTVLSGPPAGTYPFLMYLTCLRGALLRARQTTVHLRTSQVEGRWHLRSLCWERLVARCGDPRSYLVARSRGRS